MEKEILDQITYQQLLHIAKSLRDSGTITPYEHLVFLLSQNYSSAEIAIIASRSPSTIRHTTLKVKKAVKEAIKDNQCQLKNSPEPCQMEPGKNDAPTAANGLSHIAKKQTDNLS